MMQGWYSRRKLNRATTWSGPNCGKQRIATVDSCFDLVGSRQYGVAKNEVIGWSTDHPRNADGDDLRKKILQIGQCHMKKPATKNNGKNPEYHVVVAIRRLRTDKDCLAEKSWPNDVKFESHQRFSPFAFGGWSVDQPVLITCYTVLTRPKIETALHGCNSWLSVWTVSWTRGSRGPRPLMVIDISKGKNLLVVSQVC